MRSNVYAYGMLIYEVLFHRVPYQDEDQEVSLMLSFLPTSLLESLCKEKKRKKKKDYAFRRQFIDKRSMESL